MREFTDAHGRTWRIEMNVTSAKRVKALAGVDFLAIHRGELACVSQLQDVETLCDTLHALCEPQARAAGIGAEAFGEGLAGDVIDAASTALLEEIVVFTRNPRMRAAIERVLATARMAASIRMDQVEARLASAMEHVLAEAASGLPSGDARASSGSTPDRSPSAS
jgi:glutamine amidotransferase PdxT